MTDKFYLRGKMRLSVKEKIKKIPFLGPFLTMLNQARLRRHHPYYDPVDRWISKLLTDKCVSIVQIGSNDGKTGDPIFELISKNKSWQAIFVEPIPYLFDRLRDNYGNDPRFIFENVAINDGTDQTFFYVDEKAKIDLPNLPYWYDQLGSFDKVNILKHLDGILEPYIREVQLAGNTLRQLFSRNNVSHIDLLHIDAEGYDWKILSQLKLDTIKPLVILIEFKHLKDTEKEELYDFLSADYFSYLLGGDLIAFDKMKVDPSLLEGLKGKSLEVQVS